MTLSICTCSLAWYKLNVCILPQNPTLKPNPPCDGIRRQALWKEELPQMGLVPCKRGPESFLTPCALGVHKAAAYEPGSRLLADTVLAP